MPMASHDLMAFAILAAMKATERKRAEEATLLTMLPGPPATRAALASVAVGTLARDSIRREKKVAAAVITAVEAIAAGQSMSRLLLQSPLLFDLDADEIQQEIQQVWAICGTPRFGIVFPQEGDPWETSDSV